VGRHRRTLCCRVVADGVGEEDGEEREGEDETEAEVWMGWKYRE
jgi:hypothetical protein